MQGDIEAVAAKSPQGLTLLMEQVSGSEAYKQQYEELQARAMAAEERVGSEQECMLTWLGIILC
eukprot:1157814-Pelagomonas_calceolata.AAC.2